MRPTSIIFLIVSVLLIIGGFATAGVAKQLAASEGISLTDEISSEDGTYVYSYDYSRDSIGRITVNVRDAEINIIGGADKPRIELINFPEGMYEFSSSNRILMVNNNTDFSDPSNIANLAMNFKGLRSFVSYYNIGSLPKTVNIYIAESNPVKIIDAEIETGTVSLKNCSVSADYNISVGQGNVEVLRINTASALNISIDRGNARLRDCEIAKLSVNIGSGSVNAEALVEKLTAQIESGDFYYGCYGALNFTNLSLFSSVGTITVDGISHGGYLENSDIPSESVVDIDIGTGDISINSLIPRN